MEKNKRMPTIIKRNAIDENSSSYGRYITKIARTETYGNYSFLLTPTFIDGHRVFYQDDQFLEGNGTLFYDGSSEPSDNIEKLYSDNGVPLEMIDKLAVQDIIIAYLPFPN